MPFIDREEFRSGSKFAGVHVGGELTGTVWDTTIKTQQTVEIRSHKVPSYSQILPLVIGSQCCITLLLCIQRVAHTWRSKMTDGEVMDTGQMGGRCVLACLVDENPPGGRIISSTLGRNSASYYRKRTENQ